MTATSTGNTRYNARHRAVARAIDAGSTTLSAIVTATGISLAQVTASVQHLRLLGVVETTFKATRPGASARYGLTRPIDVALSVLPMPGGGIRFDALQEALGTPPSIAATLATQAKPRRVERMGRWDAPMGRPKSAGKAYA